ncbi:hypothetical protein BMS3Abin08_00656 [bacterium BMS3Abin08]|nr:hypothetical protein BMS3Abin08_00656 [bacterium BMS3Abin08]
MKDDLQSRDPLHEGIFAYSVSCLLSRDRDIEGNELRRFAGELMVSVSGTCFHYGAIDIGHIKAYIETGTGFLYADTLGDAGDVTIEGREGNAVHGFRLVLNSVIYGITEEAVKEATEEALERTISGFGLSRQPVAPKVIPLYRPEGGMHDG